MKKDVMGVKIDDISLIRAVEIVENWIRETKKTKNFTGKKIATSGPEFLVEAAKDKNFRQLLNSVDLNVPDGFGLNLYAGIRHRVPGVELMLALCQKAKENGWTIGFFGGYEGVGQKAKTELERRYPGIKVLWALDGEEADKILRDLSLLRNLSPKPVDLLFIALGIKKQEQFMASASGYKVAMGVGSSLNYLAGVWPRAPKFLRLLGFEWLYRLLSGTKPRRRIWTAVVEFPWLVLINKSNDQLQSPISKDQ